MERMYEALQCPKSLFWLWKAVEIGKPNLCLVLAADWLLVLLSMGFEETEMRLNMQDILVQKSKFWRTRIAGKGKFQKIKENISLCNQN
jgi:hypothetical protein